MPRRKYDKNGWPKPGLPRPYKPIKGRPFRAERRLADNEIVQAILKHRGQLSYVAEDLGVTVGTIQRRMKQNPSIAERVDDWTERLLDKVLRKAEEAVDMGSTPVILQLLKQLGPRRQLQERLVVEGGDTPIRTENTTRVDLSNLTIEERRLLLQAYRRQAPPKEGHTFDQAPQPAPVPVEGELEEADDWDEDE